MGICLSSEERDLKVVKSRWIDRNLVDFEKQSKGEYKILLLGSSESGKSTIVKQMKIIHQNGYSKKELLTFKLSIFRNIIDSIQSIVKAIDRFGLTCVIIKEQPELLDCLMEYTITDSKKPFDPIMSFFISRIWNDPVVSKLIEEKYNEFYLMDSASHFLNEMKRITLDPKYIPTVKDVLLSRSKTIGISETRFTIANKLNIHMVDVGGQRSERKKWIHCFEGVTSIIFCVAISEYDQVLLEQDSQNRMIESLTLFDSVVNSRWFLKTSVILFLNKIDLFRKKLSKVPFQHYFPDFLDGEDSTKAVSYILWRFHQLNRAKLNIYPHITQATDTSNIRLVFTAVKDTILQNSLKESGIL